MNVMGGIDLLITPKFGLLEKVYHPRICDDPRKLIDIREYYIVRIDLRINSRITSITYKASPCRDKVRGMSFTEGRELFHTYEEALEYARELGCIV